MSSIGNPCSFAIRIRHIHGVIGPNDLCFLFIRLSTSSGSMPAFRAMYFISRGTNFTRGSIDEAIGAVAEGRLAPVLSFAASLEVGEGGGTGSKLGSSKDTVGSTEVEEVTAP